VTSERIAAMHWGLAASRPVVVSLAVISDDEELVRRVMETLERDGMIVKLSAAGPDVYAIDGSEAPPDLVVVRRSADQPGLDEVVKSVRRGLPGANVVVVLPSPARAQVGLLLSAGADGLVLERDLESSLAAVVGAVAVHHVSMPAELRHQIQPPALSYRERQILALAVAGRTNAQIGSRLFLAESTVKGHLASAFRRLGVHSRREAAALVLASDDGLRRTVLATLRLSDAVPRQGDGA
jgi:DNA-binding NarL/FixJ family response regulator